MNPANPDATSRRRRGAELEQALLRAGWEQILEAGYTGFTIDAVAERAGTSRSVLYRRWPDRGSLLEATLAFGLNQGRTAPPDTGSLREDMLQVLRTANASSSAIAPLMSVFMGAYYADYGRTFADVRRLAFGERAGQTMNEILARAVARGEADPARLTPRVRSAAVDLLRHDLLLTAAPVREEDLIAIVDEVFLPLVRPLSAAHPGVQSDIP